MATLRLSPGPDGESHFEEIALEALTERAKPGVTAMYIAGKPGFTDFHNSGRAHILTVLSGEMELGASDGAKRVVTAGDVVLMEDTTGKGHSANVPEGSPLTLSLAILSA